MRRCFLMNGYPKFHSRNIFSTLQFQTFGFGKIWQDWKGNEEEMESAIPIPEYMANFHYAVVCGFATLFVICALTQFPAIVNYTSPVRIHSRQI